jgi:hypothetical protein
MRKQLFIATLVGLSLVLGSVTVWADGTESLGTPSVLIASGTGIVGAGVGLRDGPGTIAIDVPVGATVQQVLLYWGCFATPGNQDNAITVNGMPVTSDPAEGIGGPTTFFSNVQGATFRRDITDLGLVSDGSNMLDIDGLDCDNVSNGAGVLVVFDDGSGTADIDVRDGSDLAFVSFAPPLDTTVAQTFAFDASAADRTADLVLFVHSVADYSDRPSVVEITTNGPSGTTIPLNNLLGSNDGGEWDTVNISVAVPAETTMLTVQVLSEDRLNTGNLEASLDWSAAGLAIREDEPPGLDGRITGGGSNFTTGGVRITKGLQLHCDLRDPNNFQINWPGSSFHLLELTAANCTEDPDIIQQPPASSPFDTFNGSGTGRLKMSGTTDFDATVEFILVDQGEPGVNDTARIEIRNGEGDVVLFVESELHKGNFQTHKD